MNFCRVKIILENMIYRLVHNKAYDFQVSQHVSVEGCFFTYKKDAEKSMANTFNFASYLLRKYVLDVVMNDKYDGDIFFVDDPKARLYVGLMDETYGTITLGSVTSNLMNIDSAFALLLEEYVLSQQLTSFKEIGIFFEPM